MGLLVATAKTTSYAKISHHSQSRFSRRLPAEKMWYCDVHDGLALRDSGGVPLDAVSGGAGE